MKKSAIVLAIVVMGLTGLSSAWAQMVNIGLGQMEQSEFFALKAMVQGRQTAGSPAINSPIARPGQYGMVEMARAEFESLRNQMSTPAASVTAPSVAKSVQTVDIGTGEMPMEEFIALKGMVEKTDALLMEHLAIVLP